MNESPTYRGGTTRRHGFGPIERVRREPTTTWGSADAALPDGVTQTYLRLQAEDGAHLGGVLYAGGDEKTVVVINHPRADFSSHYMIPSLLDAGVAAFGGHTRYLGNDSDCIHECLIADLAAEIHALRTRGFEHVVLLGNSGGASLAGFYQAQALTAPPGRLTDTPAGDPFDLNTLDLPPADGLILLAAHIGEGAFSLNNLDPSVTDENDPLSCDPSLDMYNPANGYRQPPESSTYTAEFIERYRAAQRARCARLDAIARQIVERKRRARSEMDEAGFADRPLDDQLHVIRQATASRYLPIARFEADLSYTDLAIAGPTRSVGTIFTTDPHASNYKLTGLASVMTPEGWLSTWSGLSSRANLLDNLQRIPQPTLVVGFSADAGILPHETQQLFDVSPASDKEIHLFDADHYGNAATEPRQAPVGEAGALIGKWLGVRFG